MNLDFTNWASDSEICLLCPPPTLTLGLNTHATSFSDSFQGSNSCPHTYTEDTLTAEPSSQHSLIFNIGHNEVTKEAEKACCTQLFHKTISDWETTEKQLPESNVTKF